MIGAAVVGPFRLARLLLAAAAVVLALPGSARAQAEPPSLLQLQFDIVGVRLVVDPPALTVPKGIATQINTALVLPESAGPAGREAIVQLSRGAVVEAQLRGPEFPPTTFRVTPGQPIPLPAFALPGDYFLDGIRLVKDGVPLLDAEAEDGRAATTIAIRVIGEILVSSVTSRPLSLDEIRGKGIVIDERNFRAVNFQLALNIDGAPFTIDLPAALPSANLLESGLSREEVRVQLAAVNRQIQTALFELPPPLDRPGLNFSIAPLPFFPVLQEDDEPGFDIPPITGLLVIPGNVAFLNQFFSVILMVTNVAPDGTPLVVRHVRGTIGLPTGLDRVAGTYEAPGDDPLRLARIEGIGLQPTVEVRQAGPDGEFGTADDFDFLTPQQTGRGEFLVEGLREGGHTFDIRITGTLEGLPSGPVEVEGLAAGAVFVRNPSFSVSLAHPRTVRAGETYDLYATVTNTSQSIANLVTVSLDPFATSGAELLSEPRVLFETIRSGESLVARFRLRSQQTGQVTFSSFTGDAPGDIRLTTGVDERGVPLAPNAIVLPRAAENLPVSLVVAAQRVLGQALSVATAPAAALPPGVLFVARTTVVARGLALAEAGQRVQFGGAAELPRAVSDLLVDWLGAGQPDEGFDQILRTTEAGRTFLAEVAAVLGASFLGDPLGGQQAFAQATVARGAQLTASGGPSDAAGPALALAIAREDGVVADAEGNAIPRSGVLRFGNPESTGFIAVTRPDVARYTIEGRASAAGTFDLAVVVPDASEGLLQLRFADVALSAGGAIRVLVDLAAPGPVQARVDRDGDGVVDATLNAALANIVQGPPQVVDVLTLEAGYFDSPGSLADPATYGLLLGVLFDKPVARASVDQRSNYGLEAGNRVIGAQLQPSGRLAYLYLQKPVGALVPRTLAIAGVTDERGVAVAATTRPIRSSFTDGVRLFGQAREADGTPVPGALLALATTSGFTVARFAAGPDGSYEIDYIPLAVEEFSLTAQHPRTGESVATRARMRGAGDRMLINLIFLGKGTVRGRILAMDGVTPVPNAEVGLIPGATLGSLGRLTRANALGEYVFTNIDIGTFTLNARDGTGLAGRATGLIPKAGDEVVLDLVLTERPDDGGRVVGRVFLDDAVTPARDFRVYIGTYRRNEGEIGAIDQTTTDTEGSFAFPTFVPARDWDVVAVDPATGQLGIARVTVLARTTTSVAIVLEATGTVEGVVFDASGRPVAGAVVAGGTALGTTDSNGFFHIEGVPAGRATIQAGDPVTRKRGQAIVDLLPGQTVSAAITLEARATIRGRVLDANGNPVPFASVRIPEAGGFTFVIANSQGVYTFPDLPLGEYLLQAPGPSREAIVAYMEANGIDPCVAFTSGDGPGCAQPLTSEDAAAVIAAYQQAVQRFFSVDESLVNPPEIASLGGFGYTRARLFQDATTIVRDIRFLAQGYVAGTTQDANGLPTGALVRIRGLKVGVKGHPLFFELERKNSDPQTGAFRFDHVPRFDLETFQTAGVRGGDFQVQAATPFSPVIAEAFGQLDTATPNVDNLVVRFPGAAETNGTVSGLVVMPDGVTPAPQGTQVRISFGDLTVTTRADGTFQSVLPIPAGQYTLTAQTPTGGLRGQASVVVPAGGTVEARIRLLGLGAVNVQVQRPGGAPVAGAAVVLQRGSFPGERLQGVTDALGRMRFVNVSEGPFSVEAIEGGTGLLGRASGHVARDGEVTAVVTITASGRVTGTFLTAGGEQPIPFAQITLVGGGVQAYTTTDANGRFELTAIPVGPFTVEAFDPATNRRGQARGQLVTEGQTVDVTVLQLPRGTVAGFVVDADGVTRVAGAAVTLLSTSVVRTELLATTRPDGSFRFEGIPAGEFRLEAVDAVSGAKGEARGTVAIEGELVEINVPLEPFGAILVTVRDHTGALATNAAVTLGAGTPQSVRTGTTDTGGQVRFENLRLGRYTVVARSLADERRAGQAVVALEGVNEIVELTVALRGVGSLTVDVTQAIGTPVPSARVTVNARGGFGETGPAAGPIVGFTDDAGRVVFPSVPVGELTVVAELGPLAGAAAGAVQVPGQALSLPVRLGESGSVVGRVLLPGGTTPAFQALVTLRFTSQTAQVGTVQASTGLDGRFSFGGIPLGPVELDAFEVASQGVRRLAGTLAVLGQVLDFGDLVLDNESPRVAAVNPADGAFNVAATATVRATFNEPMDPASFTAANTRLLLGATVVPADRTLSADGRTVTLAPQAPLASGTRYTLAILGSPNGPRDESGLSLVDPFVSTFTVRDNVPPAVVSTSPAAGAVQVPPEATVRVSFSEPVASATLVLRDAAGQVVPGTTVLAVGNSVAIFSPQDLLRANTTHTFTVSDVVDLAGNSLAGGTFAASFATVDTIAPLIAALHLTGTPKSGATVTVTPAIAATDTERVEYSIDGLQPRVSSAAPFAVSFSIPVGATSVSVAATAVDRVGNRSAAFVLPIAIQPNERPTVQLVNVNGVTAVGQGDVVAFEVLATDDEGLAQVLFSAVGAASQSETVPVPGNATSFTRRFTVAIPSGTLAAPVLTVQAAAIDIAGEASAPASLTLATRDGRPPVVTIVDPAPGTQARPGGTVTVVVDATDDVGLASMTLTCNPALVGCGTRVLSDTGTRQSFTLEVPASLEAPATISLLASATDTAGNTGAATRTLPVADVVPPQVTALATAGGAARVLPGETAAIVATVTDNVALQAVVFTATSGDFSTSQTVAASGTSATASFNLPVPATLGAGAVLDVTAVARDAAGNAGSPASLALVVGDTAPPAMAILQPAAGAEVPAGSSIAFRVSATDDVGVRRLVFRARGAVTFDDAVTFAVPLASVENEIAIPVPVTTVPGEVVLSAEAVDAGGNASPTASRSVAVVDRTAPTVAVTSPPANAEVDPRTPIVVTVQASDNVAVAEISLTRLDAGGTATLVETRTVVPPATPRTETFSFALPALPPVPTTLGLRAAARDAAGNAQTSAVVTIRVADVVAPTVTSVDPPDGATGVSPDTLVTVAFSEPIDPATLTTASVQLRAGATVVPATVTPGGGATSVLLTPVTPPLPVNTLFTIALSGLRDASGNPLGDRTFTFRTASPDTEPPRLVAIDPPNNAVGESTTAPVTVTFSEAIDPASVTAASFRVSVDGVAIPGTRTRRAGDTQVRFTPAVSYGLEKTVVVELTGAIRDTSNNALVNADGSPVTTPITSTFLTGNFAVTSPTGPSVVEKTTITIAAEASAALAPASVVFSVNGTPLPADTEAPFSVSFTVPSAASTPQLVIVASARDGAGTEIARAETTVDVVAGLRVTPTLLGIPRGATRSLTLSLGAPAAADVAIAVSPGDPAVVTVSPADPVIAAGQTSVTVNVTACGTCPLDPTTVGKALGNTSVVATSAFGTVAAVVSVSDPIPGQEIPALATAGLAIAQAPSVGQIVTSAGRVTTTLVTVLGRPATGVVPVSVFSSNPAVATAAAADVQPGQQTTAVTVTALADGVAILTLRAGDSVRVLTVFVGTPPPDRTPLALALSAGLAIAAAPTVGQVIVAPAASGIFTIGLLSEPNAGAPILVSVTSSDPTVATATASPIATGSQVTTLAVTSGAEGRAVLTLRAGDVVCSVVVFVGTPPPDRTPVLFAPIAGVSAIGLPFIGKAFVPVAQAVTLGVLLLPEARSVPTTVTVTTSDASVVSLAQQTVVIPAGARAVALDLTTGAAGRARITLRTADLAREFEMVVGSDPVATDTPVIAALPVGVVALPNGSIGQVTVAPSVPVSTTLGITVVPAAAGADRTVTVTTSNPAVVSLGGSSTITVTLPAGATTLPLGLTTSGATGAAVITFEIDGVRRELLVVVGDVPASRLPAVTAPVVGVSVQ